MKHKNTLTSRSRQVLALLIGSLLAQGMALAGPEDTFDWSAFVGATQTDNVGRSATDERSQTEAEAGFTAQIAQRSARMTSALSADLAYRKYLDDAFEDRVTGGLDGTLKVDLLPERLSWVVQDNYAQVARNQLAQDSPANRQDTNFFTTGPDLGFRFGARTRLLLSGRWSNVYYEDTDADSNQISASAQLARQLSDRTSVSLNATGQRIDFKDDINTDYDIQAAYLGLVTAGSRTRLETNVGYTRLEGRDVVVVEGSTDSLDDPRSGLLAKLKATRELTPRSSLSLEAGSEYTDAAGLLRFDQGTRGPTNGNEDAFATADPLKTKYAFLTYRLALGRTTVTSRLGWRDENYQSDTTDDRERTQASLQLSRRVSTTVDANLRGTYTREEFGDLDQTNDDWSIGAGVTWRFLPDFSARLQLTHYDGSGDIADRSYEENRVSLRLSYAPRRH